MPPQPENNPATGGNRKRMLRVVIPLVLLVLIGLGAFWWTRGGTAVDAVTFQARKGDLSITVLEGGSIEALESQVIKSEVRGTTKVLSIVDEGYLVTPEDVENELVLVTLDDAELDDRLTQAEIEFQNATAQFTEAREQYEIQVKQNESDIKAAELELKFARLDFEKYLGANLGQQIIQDLGLDEVEARIASETTTALNSRPAPTTTASQVRLRPNRSAGERRGDGQPVAPDMAELGDRRRSGSDSGGDGAGSAEERSERPEGSGRPEGSRRPGGSGDGGGDREGPADGKPLTPAMLEAIAEAIKAKGVDFDSSRLQQMAPKGSDGQPVLTPRMEGRLSEMGIDINSIVAGAQSVGGEGPAPVADEMPEEVDIAVDPVDAAYLAARAKVDFTNYADVERLEDGEAKQTLRKMMDTELLAQEELTIAKNQLEGTEQLAARDFVTNSELEADQMSVTRSEVSLESARTALDLYIKYEFPKQCETLLSAYEEALRKLERVQKQAVSELAQEEANYKSASAQLDLKRQQRDELIEQIQNTVIVAKRPGLVVYGGTERSRWEDEVIEEGATIRERQDIITIPDMTKMGVSVAIHESSIKKIEPGQRARVRVQAYPNEAVWGQVLKVDVLPDSQNRWLNPDTKVYATKIQIDGVHNWLKPGMSAEVEILVNTLENVVYVPLQAVKTQGRQQLVYLVTASGPQPRAVETGDFNNEFIVITKGLDGGEDVYLRLPNEFQYEEKETPGTPEDEGEESAPSWTAA